ncbi:hypothetical protein LXL04_009040 [Taraxacum kok-saghyz]
MEDAEDGLLEMSSSSPIHLEFVLEYETWRTHLNRMRNRTWKMGDGKLGLGVYSSMSPIVHIMNIGSTMTESVANVTEIHEGLDFSGHDGEEEDDYSFGIFSVKFSTDGRELVVATSDDSIYVYDLVANKLNVRIPAHKSDVNAVCFADEAGHVLYSVWDRRCLGTRGVESGVLRIVARYNDIDDVKSLAAIVGAEVSSLNSHVRTPVDEAAIGGKMDVIDAINTLVAQMELTRTSV